MHNRLAVALIAACSAGSAQADWKNDYDRGVRAAAAGDWAQVDAAMRAAIAEEPKPSERKRFQGVVYKVYVPQYYAGLAAYRRGDCATAMQFWSNRESKEVVALIGELRSVQGKGIADCTAKLAAGDKPAPPVATTTPPNPQPPATTTAAPPPAATTTKPAPVATPAKPPPSEPAKPTPAPAPSIGPAPAALVQLVGHYLGGRYDAVTGADPNGLGDGLAKSHGFLLRAAARHAQAELAGGDAKLLDQARADVRAARKANAALTPDATLFSPRFRAFWSATR